MVLWVWVWDVGLAEDCECNKGQLNICMSLISPTKLSRHAVVWFLFPTNNYPAACLPPLPGPNTRQAHAC